MLIHRKCLSYFRYSYVLWSYSTLTVRFAETISYYIYFDITTACLSSQRETTVESSIFQRKCKIALLILIVVFFIFHRCHKNRFCIFVAYEENECWQSSFCPLIRTDDCRHPGGFQGRAEPAFGERPCVQGLVSYTFRHTADAKGGCGLWGSQLSCQPGRRIPRAAASGMLRPMKSGE